MNSFGAKPYACSLCGRMFSRKFDLERHERHVHPEEEEEEESSDDNEEEMEEEKVSDEENDEMEDNPTYQEWYEGAKEATEDMRREKYQKYVDRGMDPDMAKEKAYLKTVWAIKRDFFDQYRGFLRNYAHLKDDDVYAEMTGDLEEKIDKGIDVDKAVKRTVTKHESKFDGLFQYDDEEDEEEEDATEEGDED